MRILVLATVAALIGTAANPGTINSTIASIDPRTRVLQLADRSFIEVAPEVDLTLLRPGMRVEIEANIDEDGFSPATRVTPEDQATTR